MEDTVELVGECVSMGALTLGEENYPGGLTKRAAASGNPDYPEDWGMHWVYTCRAGQQCLCSSNGLPDPTCDYRANPNYGITSFDSVPWAIISLFQAISL